MKEDLREVSNAEEGADITLREARQGEPMDKRRYNTKGEQGKADG